MSYRKLTFNQNEYYHIFNRGNNKRKIFYDQEDRQYFCDRLVDFNCDVSVGGVFRGRIHQNQELISRASQLVKIVAYCLLPNHFHLVVVPLTDEGLTKFMQRLGTGYVKYFNKKHKKTGSLFSGKFKATHISQEFSLPFIVSYVNLNYRHHKLSVTEHLIRSSMDEYLDKNFENGICNKEEVSNIIKDVGGITAYEKYAYSSSNYFSQKKTEQKQLEC